MILQLKTLIQCVDRFAFAIADAHKTILIIHGTEKQVLFTEISLRIDSCRYESGTSRAPRVLDILENRWNERYKGDKTSTAKKI